MLKVFWLREKLSASQLGLCSSLEIVLTAVCAVLYPVPGYTPIVPSEVGGGQSWKQIEGRGICICDERDLLDSAVGNIVHLAVYSNGDGAEQSSNMSCVCPSLFTNRGALLPEKRDTEHIFQFHMWEYRVIVTLYVTDICLMFKMYSVIRLFPITSRLESQSCRWLFWQFSWISPVPPG
jgi:hypothetical protein